MRTEFLWVIKVSNTRLKTRERGDNIETDFKKLRYGGRKFMAVAQNREPSG
jgi:hypothetical protein